MPQAQAQPGPGTLAEYLRGLARGLGPDLLGGPVDLARDAVNLGLAGAGYAGHKLGLLRNPLPLIEPGAVGDSDWWARLTNTSDSGTPAYAAGRLTPLAGAVAKAASPAAAKLVNAMVTRSAPSRSGAPPTLVRQEGALYPGGREELIASHGTSIGDLANTIRGRGDRGILELSSPSFSVTRHRVLTEFSDPASSVLLIPREGAFDPASYPSTLLNRDAYTARWHQFNGQRVPVLGEDVWDSRRRLAQAARDRLVDRLYSPVTGKQAAGMEDVDKFRDGKLIAAPTFTGDVTSSVPRDRAIGQSPAFRSFQHYEKSPLGARLLHSYDPTQEQYREYIQKRVHDKVVEKYFPYFALLPPHTAQALSSFKMERLSKLYKEGYRGKLLQNEFHRDLTQQMIFLPEAVVKTHLHPANLEAAAQQLDKGYAKIPSGYGELKVHGMVPITQENFAGAVLRKPKNPFYSEGMAKADAVVAAALERAGLPTVNVNALPPDYNGGMTEALFDAAVELQKNAGPARRRWMKADKP